MYVLPQRRKQLSRKPVAGPTVVSPEPPAQATAPAGLRNNDGLVEFAKPDATVWRQSMKLKAKAAMCLAASSLINHTQEQAKNVLLQEMWIPPGNKILNYNLIVTDTILSVDEVTIRGTYHFQATVDYHTQVTLTVSMDTTAPIPHTSKQEYAKHMANYALSNLHLLTEDMATSALSNLRLHAEVIKDIPIAQRQGLLPNNK